MAESQIEVVSITRAELRRLRRDSAILDYIRKSDARMHPGRLPLPDLIGEMMTSEAAIQGLLAAHVRRLEARESAGIPARRGPASKSA